MPDGAAGQEQPVNQLYGLIGNPLTHSFSKKYFAEKFRNESITGCSYELFPLEQISELPALLAAHPNLCGLNVTIPFKQQVLDYLHDRSFLPLPACNCIRIEEGKLIGYNTDVAGFEQSFTTQLRPQQQAALVLGTGGASVAVQYVLNKLGIRFRLVSRNPASSEAMLTYAQLDERLMNEHTIIINCTPLGTYPAVEGFPPIPYEWISNRHYCYDLVYNPVRTMFLEKAGQKGATTRNGSDMLQIQAEESWRIWNER